MNITNIYLMNPFKILDNFIVKLNKNNQNSEIDRNSEHQYDDLDQSLNRDFHNLTDISDVEMIDCEINDLEKK